MAIIYSALGIWYVLGITTAGLFETRPRRTRAEVAKCARALIELDPRMTAEEAIMRCR